MTRNFIKLLGKGKVLVFDGGMGTMLLGKMDDYICPEEINLKNPALIESIHAAYSEAGADIITTNTFGANPIKLAAFDMQDACADICRAAIACAQNGAPGKHIAASIGPLGRQLEPLGDLPFDEAVEAYKTQAAACNEAGADLFIIETIGTLAEMRAALIAIREVSKLPIICMVTCGADGYTTYGVNPVSAMITAEALGACCFGINCSLGPEGFAPIIKELVHYSGIPIIAQPNAGLPFLDAGQTVYPCQPDEFARQCEKLMYDGVSIIGGCCGTTPAHIAALREIAADSSTQPQLVTHGVYLAGSRKWTITGNGHRPILIGERINTTARKSLREEILNGSMTTIRKEATAQTTAGADAIDINVAIGKPKIEIEIMKQAVMAVQDLTGLPVSIDSTDPAVAEAGLRHFHGRALLNSVSAEAKSLEYMLPLAKKYGAALLALPMDETGIPETAYGRLKMAEKIIMTAARYGFTRDDIIFDCLTLSIATQPNAARIGLDTLSLFKRELGVAAIAGLSNISHGMPERGYINSAFLSMGIHAGLDAAIANPLNENLKGTFEASALLLGHDYSAKRYIDFARSLEKTQGETGLAPKQQPQAFTPAELLAEAIISGDKDAASKQAQKSTDSIGPQQTVDLGVLPALDMVGKLYETGEYFLPQMLMAAESAQAAFIILRPLLIASGSEHKLGKVVIATVAGDVHDIGKNIVSLMLENHDFEVIDLGKNVPAKTIIETAQTKQADIIALSALMTTTLPEMELVIKGVRAAGLNIKVMIGGAVASQDYANEIGADGYGKDALEAVEIAKQLIG